MKLKCRPVPEMSYGLLFTKGELVQTRKYLKIPLFQNVMESLANSQYKDGKSWRQGGSQIYHDHDNASVEQHYRLTVEKDKVKRTISFNYQNKAI